MASSQNLSIRPTLQAAHTDNLASQQVTSEGLGLWALWTPIAGDNWKGGVQKKKKKKRSNFYIILFQSSCSLQETDC